MIIPDRREIHRDRLDVMMGGAYASRGRDGKHAVIVGRSGGGNGVASILLTIDGSPFVDGFKCQQYGRDPIVSTPGSLPAVAHPGDSQPQCMPDALRGRFHTTA